jgi:hypothetical protein
VADCVFFYGTLMAGFDRPGRMRIDPMLRYAGRGSIQGALFDLGIYRPLADAGSGAGAETDDHGCARRPR